MECWNNGMLEFERVARSALLVQIEITFLFLTNFISMFRLI